MRQVFTLAGWKFLLLAVLIVLALIPASASGQSPTRMTCQGALTDAAGNPVDGTVETTFAIYDAPNGGSLMWSETRPVTFDNGLFQVELGEVVPDLPPVIVPG